MFEKVETTRVEKEKKNTTRAPVSKEKLAEISECLIPICVVILCVLAFLFYPRIPLWNLDKEIPENNGMFLKEILQISFVKYRSSIITSITEGTIGALSVLLCYVIFKHLMKSWHVVMFTVVYFGSTLLLLTGTENIVIGTGAVLFSVFLVYFLLSGKYQEYSDAFYLMIGIVCGFFLWSNYRYLLFVIPYLTFIAGYHLKHKRIYTLFTHGIFMIIGIALMTAFVSVRAVYPIIRDKNIFQLIQSTFTVSTPLIIAVILLFTLLIAGTRGKGSDVYVQVMIIACDMTFSIYLDCFDAGFAAPLIINILVLIAGVIHKLTINTLVE